MAYQRYLSPLFWLRAPKCSGVCRRPISAASPAAVIILAGLVSALLCLASTPVAAAAAPSATSDTASDAYAAAKDAGSSWARIAVNIYALLFGKNEGSNVVVAKCLSSFAPKFELCRPIKTLYSSQKLSGKCTLFLLNACVLTVAEEVCPLESQDVAAHVAEVFADQVGLSLTNLSLHLLMPCQDAATWPLLLIILALTVVFLVIVYFKLKSLCCSSRSSVGGGGGGGNLPAPDHMSLINQPRMVNMWTHEMDPIPSAPAFESAPADAYSHSTAAAALGGN